ncbi:hypothetical protein EDD86DRAFT_212760 [Gorgonomyces haynaldii]|nr:hypothetical protein EDD86DRAFT_212760 [Gorgonomyces haynaldii]
MQTLPPELVLMITSKARDMCLREDCTLTKISALKCECGSKLSDPQVCPSHTDMPRCKLCQSNGLLLDLRCQDCHSELLGCDRCRSNVCDRHIAKNDCDVCEIDVCTKCNQDAPRILNKMVFCFKCEQEIPGCSECTAHCDGCFKKYCVLCEEEEIRTCNLCFVLDAEPDPDGCGFCVDCHFQCQFCMQHWCNEHQLHCTKCEKLVCDFCFEAVSPGLTLCDCDPNTPYQIHPDE